MEPSQLQVDYDVNMTALYQAICNCDWDLAIQAIEKNPDEARTWVVRYYEQEDSDQEKEIMWRFLPIHSACARDPPATLMSALLKAYPDGAHCVDDQGMYALHYACGNQASREVIRLLLVANSRAAKSEDPRGMLPIHYLACWGPSSVSIIDMVLVANRDVGHIKDNDGNTPLDLAMEGDYPERDAVVVALKRWLERGSSSNSLRSTPSKAKSTPVAPAEALVVVEKKDEEKKEAGPEDNEDEDNGNTPRSGVVDTSNSTEVEVFVTDEEDDPLGSVENKHHDEEKSISSTPSSPRTLSRLQKEVIKLRADIKRVDADWEQKMSGSVDSLTSKCQDLTSKVEELTAALAESKKQVQELEDTSTKQREDLVAAESQLSNSLEQNDELRQTLAELTDERDKQMAHIDTINDRLGSLAASVAIMRGEQQNIMQAAHERDAQLIEASQSRQDNLKMLIDMEQEFMETVIGSPDEPPVFEKQMKEMDAIAAVIAAMRVE